MITTLAEAEKALEEGLADYAADTGEQATDDVWYDMVIATAHTIVLEDSEGAALAREFCKSQLGHIPDDLKPYLGANDGLH